MVSQAERAAMEIERTADDICLAFLLQRRLLERAEEEPEFEGEVVGLIASGCFIRFGAEGFEGFLPVRRMDDYWTMNEEGTMMSAERSGGVLRLGDPMRVTVGRIDTLRGRVDSTGWRRRPSRLGAAGSGRVQRATRAGASHDVRNAPVTVTGLGRPLCCFTYRIAT